MLGLSQESLKRNRCPVGGRPPCQDQGVPGLQDPPTGGGRPPGGVGQWWCSCHRHTGAKRVLRHDGTHKAADRSWSDKRQPPNAALRLLKNVQPSPSPCAGS